MTESYFIFPFLFHPNKLLTNFCCFFFCENSINEQEKIFWACFNQNEYFRCFSQFQEISLAANRAADTLFHVCPNLLQRTDISTTQPQH